MVLVVLDSQANAPIEGLASLKSNLGEVKRVSIATLDQGATKQPTTMVLDVLGSEGTADQFWQTGAKDHKGMWTDQFLEEGDEYFSSMSSFKTNQFNPEFQ